MHHDVGAWKRLSEGSKEGKGWYVEMFGIKQHDVGLQLHERSEPGSP